MDHGQLFEQRLAAVLEPDVGNVGLRGGRRPTARAAWEMTHLVDVISCCSGQVPLLTQPMPFDLHLEPALDHRVSGQLGEGALRELVNLHTTRSQQRAWVNSGEDVAYVGRDAVLFEQRFLETAGE